MALRVTAPALHRGLVVVVYMASVVCSHTHTVIYPPLLFHLVPPVFRKGKKKVGGVQWHFAFFSLSSLFGFVFSSFFLLFSFIFLREENRNIFCVLLLLLSSFYQSVSISLVKEKVLCYSIRENQLLCVSIYLLFVLFIRMCVHMERKVLIDNKLKGL